MEGFETYLGFPQAAGAIDGSHIPIIRPDESASDYYNRKGYYSVIVQAMVDFRGLFMDVYIGWPGRVHDARVFVNSTLYQKGTSGMLFPNWKRNICRVDVSRSHILYLLSIHYHLGINDLITIFPCAGATGSIGRSGIPFLTMAYEALSK